MSLFATEVIIALLAVMPGLIYLLRLYNTGYILDTTQKSARDKLFETLAGIPIRLFVVVNLFIPMINGSDKWLWLQATPYTLTISLLLLTLYNLSLYKLYKDEFRVSAI
jgi:sterol desaturase/sphingolipid hydroxylase (fatty acid hydroxylase superfamily)